MLASTETSLTVDSQRLLLNNNKLLSKAMEVSSEGILISDNQGNVVYVNSAYENTTGLKKDQIIGKNLQRLLDEKMFNVSATLLVLESKKQVSIIHKYYTGRIGLTTANPIYDDDGLIIGVINNTRNISELIKLKNDLVDTKFIQKYSMEFPQTFQQQLRHEGFIYTSKVMGEVVKFASTVAIFDTTVLISGESGTGKEVLAKFIHQKSARKEGPFIKVNCAAIPTELFESELFGYAPGSFTGASVKGKCGMFELANDGTILLDEISELPLMVQSKLLRVIQEREVSRVGGSTPIKLNVRILAATNKNLKNEVELGNFREDLFFRINVVPITIPLLRERKEDIPQLIGHFLEKLNKRYKRTTVILSEAIEMMTNYSWPGNVRELENLVEYLFITCLNDEISADQLPMQILATHISTKCASEANGCFLSKLEYMLDLFEKNIITSTLKDYPSIRKTSQALGIHPSTLSRKIKKHAIQTDL